MSIPEHKSIGHAAARGAAAMAVRQVLGSGISICGSIVLARILSPTDYGVFAIVTFFVSLFGLISDVGLGASLIRQQETPDPKDVAAIFTFQQLMMFVFIAGIWIASPWISSAYSLNTAQTWMIRIMPLNLLWASFQSFANISLERKLHFPALARIEITQTICYNGLAVALAVLDFGAWAFVAATLVRTIIGATGSIWLSRWKPTWNTEFYRLKGRLRFGLMYQGASTLSWIKDAIIPTLIGMYVGAEGVGYVGWANSLAVWGVLALQPLSRVYFPVFSRLQSDSQALGRFLERILCWANRIVAPVSLGVLAVAPTLVHVVYTDKWLPALPLMYLLSFANAFAASGGPCMSLLNAIGKSGWNLAMTAIWMAMTWIVGMIAIPKYGILGFGIANIATSLTGVIPLFLAYKHAPFHFLSPILVPWGIAGGCALPIGYLVRSGWFGDGIPSLAIPVAIFATSYLVASFSLFHRSILRDIELVRKQRT
ncbi:MAG: hypothetical protein RL173_1043 [Fibrobacterota bacterium]|jgi:O-antigen/teichoic acid export membrane protein